MERRLRQRGWARKLPLVPARRSCAVARRAPRLACGTSTGGPARGKSIDRSAATPLRAAAHPRRPARRFAVHKTYSASVAIAENRGDPGLQSSLVYLIKQLIIKDFSWIWRWHGSCTCRPMEGLPARRQGHRLVQQGELCRRQARVREDRGCPCRCCRAGKAGGARGSSTKPPRLWPASACLATRCGHGARGTGNRADRGYARRGSADIGQNIA